jgi:hypothetical protein
MTDETIHAQEPQDEPIDEGVALIFEQIEELVPPVVRTQVAKHPLTFVLLGLGVGLFLGAKKGDELLAAGATMLTTAVAASFNAKLGGEARE